MFDEDISTGRRLFFVQGLWRSGTSWVGQMLGSDPRIYVCPHELQTFMRMLRVTQFGEPLASNPFLQTRYASARKTAFLSMLQHLQRSEKPNATRIGERSPGADVRLLKENFPAAKIVIVLRDGRDVCVSSAFLALATGANPTIIEEGSGRLALDHVIGSALAYATYIPDYFLLKTAHPHDVLLVRYEDVHRDTAGEMTKVFAFLDIDLDAPAVEAICRDHVMPRHTVRAASQEDARFWARKGAIGDWRNHLEGDALWAFENIAGAGLQQAGYTLSPVAEPGTFPAKSYVALETAQRMTDELRADLRPTVAGPTWWFLRLAGMSLGMIRRIVFRRFTDAARLLLRILEIRTRWEASGP